MLIAIYLAVFLLVIVFFVALYVIFTYNRFVKLIKTVENALSDVDVFLKKRFNLVANLVETVKAYAGHESGVFEKVAALRSNAMQMTTINDRSEFDDTLKGLFKSLFAVAENYPQLKADENFRQLQGTLKELENGIESARRYYNAVVRDYNILLDSFPSNIVGKSFGFTEQEFFDASDEEGKLQRVDFSVKS